MTDATLYTLYGFLGDQYGNQGFYTETLPFYKDNEGVFYRQKQEEEVTRVEPTEMKYIWPVKAEVQGTLDQIVIITGEDFLSDLDALSIANDITTWEKEDVFFWKLSTREEYKSHQTAFKSRAVEWLTAYLKAEEKPSVELVDSAITVIGTSGEPTKEDYALTGLASRRAGDLVGYRLQALLISSQITDDHYDNVEEYDKAVDALEASLLG